MAFKKIPDSIYWGGRKHNKPRKDQDESEYVFVSMENPDKEVLERILKAKPKSDKKL